jgi:hypothetical protein
MGASLRHADARETHARQHVWNQNVVSPQAPRYVSLAPGSAYPHSLVAAQAGAVIGSLHSPDFGSDLQYDPFSPVLYQVPLGAPRESHLTSLGRETSPQDTMSDASTYTRTEAWSSQTLGYPDLYGGSRSVSSGTAVSSALSVADPKHLHVSSLGNAEQTRSAQPGQLDPTRPARLTRSVSPIGQGRPSAKSGKSGSEETKLNSTFEESDWPQLLNRFTLATILPDESQL